MATLEDQFYNLITSGMPIQDITATLANFCNKIRYDCAESTAKIVASKTAQTPNLFNAELYTSANLPDKLADWIYALDASHGGHIIEALNFRFMRDGKISTASSAAPLQLPSLSQLRASSEGGRISDNDLGSIVVEGAVPIDFQLSDNKVLLKIADDRTRPITKPLSSRPIDRLISNALGKKTGDYVGGIGNVNEYFNSNITQSESDRLFAMLLNYPEQEYVYELARKLKEKGLEDDERFKPGLLWFVLTCKDQPIAIAELIRKLYVGSHNASNSQAENYKNEILAIAQKYKSAISSTGMPAQSAHSGASRDLLSF